eukprot:CAMPEP_0206538934 /NCGR_PEP_ID=MMETSP0325_2-20121206/8156_1 /ASSEMBLY_ACC=CAM_ASM_000347 /TAXON_ID=2866 /ORGANISM="Crypthecodinium cohnii, Strain Seligo" /LENGTH=379 /DNA_ID=CAMNT_0054036463 /DNA_START=674 /DNA_END=1816 /DNA_ORIENTATION=-
MQTPAAKMFAEAIVTRATNWMRDMLPSIPWLRFISSMTAHVTEVDKLTAVIVVITSTQLCTLAGIRRPGGIKSSAQSDILMHSAGDGDGYNVEVAYFALPNLNGMPFKPASQMPSTFVVVTNNSRRARVGTSSASHALQIASSNLASRGLGRIRSSTSSESPRGPLRFRSQEKCCLFRHCLQQQRPPALAWLEEQLEPKEAHPEEWSRCLQPPLAPSPLLPPMCPGRFHCLPILLRLPPPSPTAEPNRVQLPALAQGVAVVADVDFDLIPDLGFGADFELVAADAGASDLTSGWTLVALLIFAWTSSSASSAVASTLGWTLTWGRARSRAAAAAAALAAGTCCSSSHPEPARLLVEILKHGEHWQPGHRTRSTGWGGKG